MIWTSQIIPGVFPSLAFSLQSSQKLRRPVRSLEERRYRPTSCPLYYDDSKPSTRDDSISTRLYATNNDEEDLSRSTSEASTEQNQEEKKTASLMDTFVFVLRLPFLYANTLASTNDRYLEQRDRSAWWSRREFPKLPKYTIRDAIKDDRVLYPSRLVAKMAPLGVIFFSATFNLCILQTMKDSLIVSTIGAESLPFLASFGVLPASFIFFGIYHRMLNKVPSNMVFYLAIIPLLAVYSLFVIFLYPASSWLHPYGIFDAVISHIPLGFHGLIRCLEHWTFSIFFCVAELWGSVVISVLFWSLANDICTVKEARTIYPLMGLSANLALVFAGKIVKLIIQKIASRSTLLCYRLLIGIVLFNSFLMMAAKFFIDNTLSKTNMDSTPKKRLDMSKKGSKGSLENGLKVLKESPKILNLALLVIGYSVSHRFFEVVWKGQLRTMYPTQQQYQSVLADVSVWTGASTITMMITGKFIFQYLGWGFAASAPPIIMMITGSIFYLSFYALHHGVALNVAMIGVMAGNATQVATRAAKFSLFDPAKEMVYIEMSKEEKSKGKAAVDLVGSQVGKTGASWVSQALLLVFGSISAAMPVFGCLYIIVIIMWLFAVKQLQKLLIQTEAERKQTSPSDTMDSSKDEDEKSERTINENSHTTTISSSLPSTHLADISRNKNGTLPISERII